MKDEIQSTRRSMLGLTGKGVLSVAAIGVLGDAAALANAAGTGSGAVARQGDIDILNVALALEYEAVEAYQIGAESGLLNKPVLNVALTFQGHHKEHAEALVETIRELGGKHVDPRSRADYATSLNIAAIRDQSDILRLAQSHERGAANAYIGVIPSLADPDLSQVCARIAADEAAHWSVLSHALAEAMPKPAFMFG